jgi:hypothetical protein
VKVRRTAFPHAYAESWIQCACHADVQAVVEAIVTYKHLLGTVASHTATPAYVSVRHCHYARLNRLNHSHMCCSPLLLTCLFVGPKALVSEAGLLRTQTVERQSSNPFADVRIDIASVVVGDVEVVQRRG